jgi:hypothetical protein
MARPGRPSRAGPRHSSSRAQPGRRLGRAPPRRVAGRRGDLVGEDLGVQAAGDRPDAVAGLVGDDQRLGPAMVAENPAQGRYTVLHLAPGGVRRVLAPDRVDQVVHRYESMGAQQQHGEHRPRPGPAQRDRLAVERGTQRAEHVEGHHRWLDRTA